MEKPNRPAGQRISPEQHERAKQIIKSRLSRESSDDLALYSDMALQVLMEREGIYMTLPNVAYLRAGLGYQGVPKRQRALIEQGKNT